MSSPSQVSSVDKRTRFLQCWQLEIFSQYYLYFLEYTEGGSHVVKIVLGDKARKNREFAFNSWQAQSRIGRRLTSHSGTLFTRIHHVASLSPS